MILYALGDFMENLEKEIINNKNKFIYWDNKEEKSETLKSLADSRPIVLNSSSPIVVYTNNFSLDKFYSLRTRK